MVLYHPQNILGVGLLNPAITDAYAGRVMATNHANWVFGPFFRAFNGYLEFLAVKSPDAKDNSGSRFFGVGSFVYSFFDYFVWDSKFHTRHSITSCQGVGYRVRVVLGKLPLRKLSPGFPPNLADIARRVRN